MSRATSQRPFYDQSDRAVDFAFQGAQFVFNVLRLAQFAAPLARCQLPGGMCRSAGRVGE